MYATSSSKISPLWSRSLAAATTEPRASTSGPTRCASARAAHIPVLPFFRPIVSRPVRTIRRPWASVRYHARMIVRCHSRNRNRRPAWAPLVIVNDSTKRITRSARDRPGFDQRGGRPRAACVRLTVGTVGRTPRRPIYANLSGRLAGPG